MKKALRETSAIIDGYLAPPDIHDAERETSGGLITCVISVLVLLAEIWIVRSVLLGGMSLALGLLLHALISVLLLCYARLLLKDREESRFAWLIMVATAGCGPFGAAGTLLTILVFAFSHRRHVSFVDVFETIFPSLLQSRAQRIYDDILIGRDEAGISYSVIPFLDVMAFGSEMQKRTALTKMTTNFHPEFAPVFKKALNDPSNMIRVQAAAAIAKVETMFLKRMIRLSMIASHHRNDKIIVRALADHYDNYAYTGLLDEDRERINRQKALEHYRHYLTLDPDSAMVRARIGRLLLRRGDYADACAWFKECLEKGDAVESISDWYSEALFACGRYAELREFRATLPPREREREAIMNPALKESLEFWSPPPEAA